MCGRYVIAAPEDLSERFQLRDFGPLRDFRPTWNAAPSQALPVIVENDAGEREVRLMQWGLLPRWHRPGSKADIAPINARSETVLEKPMFRGLVGKRRCLVPANGFYEWQQRGPQGTKKQPFYITLADEPIFAMAGLWDETTGEDGLPVASYTVITTAANELVKPLHERMAAILEPGDEDDWLDPKRSNPAEVVPMLRPYPAERMHVYPVSSLVSNVRNNGPELLSPTTEQSALF